MDPVTLAASVLVGVFQNKEVQNVTKEAAAKFKTWASEWLMDVAPKLANKLIHDPDSAEVEELAKEEIATIVQEPDLLKVLDQKLKELQPDGPVYQWTDIKTTGDVQGKQTIIGNLKIDGDGPVSIG